MKISSSIMRDVSFSMENGILIGICRKDLILNIETAINEVGYSLAASAGIYHPFLLELDSVRSFSQEAMRYLLFGVGGKYFSAVAIVVRPFWKRFFLKIFKTLQGTGMPIKLFDNRNDALAWLKSLDLNQHSFYSDHFDGHVVKQ